MIRQIVIDREFCDTREQVFVKSGLFNRWILVVRQFVMVVMFWLGLMSFYLFLFFPISFLKFFLDNYDFFIFLIYSYLFLFSSFKWLIVLVMDYLLSIEGSLIARACSLFWWFVDLAFERVIRVQIKRRSLVDKFAVWKLIVKEEN